MTHDHSKVQSTIPLKPLVIGILLGFVFGFALEKSKVFMPGLIRTQMHFTTFSMLKMFLAATAAGSFFMSAMEYFGHFQRPVPKGSSLGFKDGHGANILGGFLLGIGMFISGACPGTVVVQLSSFQLWSAKWSFFGVIAGSWFFGYFVAFMHKMNKSFLEKVESISFDKYFKIPGITLSLAIGFGLFSMLGIVEYFHPWFPDVEPYFKEVPYNYRFMFDPFAPVWNPTASGILIATLQVPSWYLLSHHLGTSAGYITFTTFIAKIFDPKIFENAPYFSNYFTTSDFAQLGTLIGISIATAVSQYLSGIALVNPTNKFNDSVNFFGYFFGGFLLAVGSRLAGGCTSGHGITGMARLNGASTVAVCAMFGGAILTGLLLD